MIRPITILTFLMASGSGLYLYQSKHEVQVLDRTIEKRVHETGALREQSRLLAAEWTMLNDPERLSRFANTYLDLKSINPNQFTSLADLDSRLPPVETDDPAQQPAPETQPVASDAAPQTVAEGDAAAASVDAAVVPEVADAASSKVAVTAPPKTAVTAPQVVAAAAVPRVANASAHVVTVPPRVAVVVPRPQLHPVVAASNAVRPAPVHAAPVVRSVETRVAAARPTPVDPAPRQYQASETRPWDQRPVQARFASTHAEPRRQPAPHPVIASIPRPLPQRSNEMAYAAPRPAPAPFGGSLLGMAHGSMPPAPRPTPVNASYNEN